MTPPRARKRPAGAAAVSGAAADAAAVMVMTDDELRRHIEAKLLAADVDNLEGVSTASAVTGRWAVYLRWGARHQDVLRILEGIPRLVDVHVSPAAAMSRSIIVFRAEPAEPAEGPPP